MTHTPEAKTQFIIDVLCDKVGRLEKEKAALLEALEEISSHRLHATKHNDNAFEMLIVVVNIARNAIALAKP